ncbi:MAG: YraN family protein [Actinobacteria bacterium]|nr:YraN family protein [Actinomycetota bacterium]
MEKDPASEGSQHETGPKRNSKRELGARGEEAAARYLERQEFEILERNWKCSYGEADIIAREDEDIVFIEVKTRKGIEKGMPEDAVTPTKRDRYERIAASFLENNAFVNCFVRFDVIAILVVGENRALLRHHRGAFSSGD